MHGVAVYSVYNTNVVAVDCKHSLAVNCVQSTTLQTTWCSCLSTVYNINVLAVGQLKHTANA